MNIASGGLGILALACVAGATGPVAALGPYCLNVRHVDGPDYELENTCNSAGYVLVSTMGATRKNECDVYRLSSRNTISVISYFRTRPRVVSTCEASSDCARALRAQAQACR